jgi:hypothetical protein
MPSRIAAVVAACALAAGSARAAVLERILAVVESRPVLLSEVRVLQAVRGVSEKAALEELIDERLMLREAGRLAQSAVSPDEEERALEGLLSTNPSARVASTDDLRRLVRRQTTIVKYVDFRFRPQVSVSEDDVRRAYEARYAGAADAPPPEAVEPTLREELTRKALDERIEAWVKELRAAADIRYN